VQRGGGTKRGAKGTIRTSDMFFSFFFHVYQTLLNPSCATGEGYHREEREKRKEGRAP